MTQAEEMLQLYLDAERKALLGQSFSFRGRAMTRANLSEIVKGRNGWQRIVNNEKARAAGGSASYSVVSFGE